MSWMKVSKEGRVSIQGVDMGGVGQILARKQDHIAVKWPRGSIGTGISSLGPIIPPIRLFTRSDVLIVSWGIPRKTRNISFGWMKFWSGATDVNRDRGFPNS